MNFFVRIVTAPSDMVDKDLQSKGSSGELGLAKDALWPMMGFAGERLCEGR